MILFSWISYQGVKNAAIRSGKERLLSLTSQLGQMFSQSMQTLSNSTRTQANRPAIKKFLADSNRHSSDSAMSVLMSIRQDSTSVYVALLDTNYKTLIYSAKDSIHLHVNFDSLTTLLSAKRDTAIGKIYAIRDSMYYPVIRRITTNKQTTGYLLRWRILSTSPKTIQQLSELMGTKAALFIGNDDGSLWTDMVKPVSFYPLNSLQINKAVEQKTKDGKRNLTTVSKINNTPWLVSVEFARQTLLASANRFLRWMVIGGLVLLAIGILLAWITSRNIIRPLNRLTEATSGIASGNYIPTEGVNRRDEVGKLARAFNAMIEQVREARQGLEQKIVESGEMNEQLRNLTAHLQNIREEERIHIAREMHDELGQLLTAFKMDISWLQKKLAPHNGDAIFEKLGDMNKLIDDSVLFVRKIASELRPSVLDDFGLVPALEWHSEEFQKRFHIEVDFKTETRELKTSSLIATGLFRMYQESLTNVARHSKATKVFTRLEVNDNIITLSVRDNGMGFDMHATDQKKTLGLLGMKERAVMIAGNLRIESAPGTGTMVVITVNNDKG